MNLLLYARRLGTKYVVLATRKIIAHGGAIRRHPRSSRGETVFGIMTGRVFSGLSSADNLATQ